ncbi:hypothetical protein [Burkholderia alba]|uniref:hypothetical protein n=1 Tax=Burkholderia alba TaxID=2683677 RepID=UPI002B05DBAC|nr:hypothetical protein [Burkholderia alba]
MIHNNGDERVAERVIGLGAGRLADMLVECAETNPSLQRRLLAELFAHAAADVIAPIRQWIADLRDDASLLNRGAYRAPTGWTMMDSPKSLKRSMSASGRLA